MLADVGAKIIETQTEWFEAGKEAKADLIDFRKEVFHAVMTIYHLISEGKSELIWLNREGLVEIRGDLHITSRCQRRVSSALGQGL